MAESLDPALARRLESLRGEDAACCALDLQSLADEAQAAPDFNQALRQAKALADEKRLLAAALLKRRGDLCACEIQAALDLTHATVSHHMSTLRAAGVVTAERRGKWMHYRLRDDVRDRIP